MSILKITALLQMLVANKILAVNKVGAVKDGDKSIEKYGKLLKTRSVKWSTYDRKH